MKQADLARAIGANNHTVWRYETQGMTPSAPRLRKIAEQLGVSERFLLTGSDAAEPDVELDEMIRTALLRIIADWDPVLHGEPPTDEERHWLGFELDFRTDRRGGLEITPRLLFDRLMERRRQARGRTVERPKLPPPPSRPGARRLSSADAARKKKGKR